MPLCKTYIQKTTKINHRIVINLDGIWDIDEGLMDVIPRRFSNRKPLSEDIFNIRTVEVPGLVDLATPPLPNYGWSAKHRQAFWYHRTFEIADEIPQIAILKIHKARYGTQIFINDQHAGNYLPNFTPGYFDIRPLLNPGTNKLLVRVGAFPDSVPDNITRGGDSEMINFIPGIYDTVELILSNTPHITNIRVAPEIHSNSIQIATCVHNQRPNQSNVQIQYIVREWASGKIVASGQTDETVINAEEIFTFNSRIQIENCHLWSPEDPFLYEIEADTGYDTIKSRFGMRSFRFDRTTKFAMLNGKPYFMRGANVCALRFFEDPLRGNLPWNEQWVQQLHTRFRQMHWNTLRYTMGFPPEKWYEIADEVGFLIQDEFPLWYPSDEGLGKWPETLNGADLAKEYSDWILERHNHPCVVIWNAANETRSDETGKAIVLTKHLDLTSRPWGNSWGAWQDPNGAVDAHTYLFIDHVVNEPPDVFRLSDLAHTSGVPRRGVEADLFTQIPCDSDKAIFINEYDWFWLNRDGTPTTLTEKLYINLLGPDATNQQRRRCCARMFAALTEFWRCHRQAAAVVGPFGLGHSRFDGRTCDHFQNIVTLEFEPYFQEYVSDAFSPVGLMVDEWAQSLPARQSRKIRIVAINDTAVLWNGDICLEIAGCRGSVLVQQQNCTIEPLGSIDVYFECILPSEPGDYQIIGSLNDKSTKPIRSLRDVQII